MKKMIIALKCAAHRHGVKLEGVKMKKRMTITMLAIAVGMCDRAYVLLAEDAEE